MDLFIVLVIAKVKFYLHKRQGRGSRPFKSLSWKFPSNIVSVSSLRSSLIAKMNANRSEGSTLFTRSLSFEDAPFEIYLSTSTAPMQSTISDDAVIKAFERAKGKSDEWLKICIFNCSSFAQQRDFQNRSDFFNFQPEPSASHRGGSNMNNSSGSWGNKDLVAVKSAFERSRALMTPTKLVPKMGPSTSSASRRNIEESQLVVFQLCSEYVQNQEDITILARESALFKLRTTCLDALKTFFDDLRTSTEAPTSRAKRDRPSEDDTKP